MRTNIIKEVFCYPITFETKCYEKDWEYLLKTNYLNNMINNCNYNFKFKQLIINNVDNPEKVKIFAQKKIDKGIIDAYYFVDDYIDEALKCFDIKKESFGTGYYYSSAELVGIYLSKTKYHLHFSSDAFMNKKNKNSRWIHDACEILNSESKYFVANPMWDYSYNTICMNFDDKRPENFFVGYGFSDQCYLIRTDDFKKDIYNYSHPASKRYPKYGGELFEKRVDSYMQTKGLLRLIARHESYIHRNFSKSKYLKLIILILIRCDLYFPIRNLVIILKNTLYRIKL
ncbi:hypothetical protein [Treponema primitia]|uniref:hypothetical protein n=1 Tax=Treponema primitia TaxID=88058 RepID=UPI0002554EC7|nr:hypothetical protein [Treponema primitia]